MRLPVYSFRLHPWISMVVAYSLALQIVFGGVLIGQMAAASTGSSEFSAICLSHNSAADEDGTRSGQLPSAHDPICVCCTLAGGPAMLPDTATPLILDFSQRSAPEPRGRDIAVALAFLTGHYQRGPPAARAFVG